MRDDAADIPTVRDLAVEWRGRIERHERARLHLRHDVASHGTDGDIGHAMMTNVSRRNYGRVIRRRDAALRQIFNALGQDFEVMNLVVCLEEIVGDPTAHFAAGAKEGNRNRGWESVIRGCHQWPSGSAVIRSGRAIA